MRFPVRVTHHVLSETIPEIFLCLRWLLLWAVLRAVKPQIVKSITIWLLNIAMENHQF